MELKIALAGNPNVGKTTLFNALTGSNQFVGNWPGVTVEKKAGKLKHHKDIVIIDLPGIYSLSPYTLEEVVARNYLINDRPDAILNIIDGTNLERNLYLTTQLTELGIPVVVAINMIDVVHDNKDIIHTKKLAQELGCPVMEISAKTGLGITEATEEAARIAGQHIITKPQHRFSGCVEHAIAHIEEATQLNVADTEQRWYAIKLFERDIKVREKLQLADNILEHIEHDIVSCEEEMNDDAESIITNERYNYISSIIADCNVKNTVSTHTLSDRIDRIVTNRILALPIFAVIMFLVYYISVTTVGTELTDWTNKVLFGDIIQPVVSGFLTSVGCAPWLQSLILDGIIAGVGSVLGFVPQMFVLFTFLAFLEACGYMARIAFIMDRIFRKFGLSGKSFIPMLIGTGCGVPGIMASRTIENDHDRKMTIMTTTFIPCSAKLPIIALIAGALFNGEWWIAPSAYFVGITAIVASGIILKKTTMFASEPAPFVMELPPYHLPTFTNIWRSVWERGSSFVQKAGTVILLSTIFIWFTSNFGVVDGHVSMVENLSDGFLASIGSTISWIFTPLGWGNWQATVAAVTGLVAKENVVGTLGVLYGFADVSEDGTEIWGAMANSFTIISAYSFLVFNLLCAPCFAAMGAIRREMNNTKWTLFAIGYQTGFAYAVSLCIYQFGNFITTGIFSVGTAAAFIILTGFIYLLFRPAKKAVTLKNTRSVAC